MGNDSESRPLLSNSSDSPMMIPPVPSEEIPFAPTVPTNGNLLACLVCGSMIDVTYMREQHVVKCANCNEATPLRPAPPGRRFVRCPCNCLLVCNVNASRISCPRAQCRRLIIVSGDSPGPDSAQGTRNLLSATSATTASASNELDGSLRGLNRILCAHCDNTFFFNMLDNCPARCPHCRKLSTVYKEYARTRAIVFLAIALIFLALFLGTTIGTVSMVRMGSAGYIVLDICVGIIFVYFSYRSISYFRMKLSKIVPRSGAGAGVMA